MRMGKKDCYLVNKGIEVHHALDPSFLTLPALLSVVLLHLLLQRFCVGTLQLIQPGLVPEEHEGGHCRDSLTCSCLLALVNIHLKNHIYERLFID